MSNIQNIFKLGHPPWPTLDPFLFCVHHNDEYPAADENMHPKASLGGRNIGSDFSSKDGWSMYHGTGVPGFPSHPHRGFETVTLARKGYIDHSDSLGATARFGQGDVQWMTAGSGIVHSEMFPLLNQNAPNPTELFQIWLNLPKNDKMVKPYFTMFWDKDIPTLTVKDDSSVAFTKLKTVAGVYNDKIPPPPPPNSWASDPNSDVAIWTIQMPKGAKWTLPASAAGLNRVLYFFDGEELHIDGQPVSVGNGIKLNSNAATTLYNETGHAELLLLQGRPLGEPVVQYGPFVMNTEGEVRQAMSDYKRTQFGGWPWKRRDPVHGEDPIRFAVHSDGRREEA